MKRFACWMISALLSFMAVDVYALTAVEARGMSNPKLMTALKSMSDDELMKFCKEVFSGNDRVLQSRVRVQLQMLMRSMPSVKAKALAQRLNTEVPDLTFVVSGEGHMVVIVAETSAPESPTGSYLPRPDSSSKPLSSGATRTGL